MRVCVYKEERLGAPKRDVTKAHSSMLFFIVALIYYWRHTG